MRTALALAAIVLAAGCTQEPPPGADEDAEGPEVPQAPWPARPPACATLAIEAPSVERALTPTTFDITLENCGNTTIDLPAPPCADPPRGFVLDIYPAWDEFGYRHTSAGLRRTAPPCAPSNETATKLAPGQRLTIALEWDLTVPDPRCGRDDGTCASIAAPPGAYRLVAIAPAGGRIFSAEAQIRILPQALDVALVRVHETFELATRGNATKLTYGPACETGSLDEATRTIRVRGIPPQIPLVVVLREVDLAASQPPEGTGAGENRTFVALVGETEIRSILTTDETLVTISEAEVGVRLGEVHLREEGDTTQIEHTTTTSDATIRETLRITHAGTYTLLLDEDAQCL